MAIYFKDQNEIRIYSINDISGHRQGLLSNDNKFISTNKMRVAKMDMFTFDYDNTHFAKVCIVEPPARSPDEPKIFTIKSRHCQRCSRKGRYFCQPDKNWDFEQELGSFIIVSSMPMICYY